MHSLVQNSRRVSRRSSQRGFSLMELLIVVAIILIIAMVAVPKMNVALMGARESAAIREISTIHTAQTQYYSQFGHYAANLAQLGPSPSGGTPGPNGADLLTGTLATGKASGHVFVLQITPTGYSVNVSPEKFGTDGRRNFYSDQTLDVHEKWSAELATVADPLLGGGGGGTTAAPAAATPGGDAK